MEKILNWLAFALVPRRLFYLEIRTFKATESRYTLEAHSREKQDFILNGTETFTTTSELAEVVGKTPTIVRITGERVLTKKKGELTSNMLDSDRFEFSEWHDNDDRETQVSVMKRHDMDQIKHFLSSKKIRVIELSFATTGGQFYTEGGVVGDQPKKNQVDSGYDNGIGSPLMYKTNAWKNWRTNALSFDFLLKRLSFTYFTVFLFSFLIGIAFLEIKKHSLLEELEASRLMLSASESELHAAKVNEQRRDKIASALALLRPMKVSYTEALEDVARSTAGDVRLNQIDFFSGDQKRSKQASPSQQLSISGTSSSIEGITNFLSRLIKLSWIESASVVHFDGGKDEFEIQINFEL